MATASPTTTELPSRASTMPGEEAVPDYDPTTTSGLLSERLQAYKHACGYLEDYFAAVEKIHGKHAKEYEKALKTISNPLKEGHHFDQSLGGVAGFFENLRTNTQALINTNIETEKSIKGSALPILERLHKEIKNKAKELSHGAEKGAKEVEKVRNTTQKHIELLGQQTAAFDSAGGKISSGEDPYVVHRGVLHRLSTQVISENNFHNDLIAVQNNFSTFEAHVIEVFQQAIEVFTQLAGGQGEKTRALHNDVLGAVQRIPGDFEWSKFTARSSDRLASPNEAPRTVDTINFANSEHASTKPLIEGSLERKSRNKLSWGYSPGYYVVTPSKYLHEFKDSDNTRTEPKPELSIFLPDAMIGAPNGDKFSVKGKDKSKSIGGKLTGSTEINFKAHSAADAQKWFAVIQTVAGGTGPAEPDSVPTTPVIGSDEKPQMNLPTPADEKPQPVEAAPVTTAAEDHAVQQSGVTPAEGTTTTTTAPAKV